MRGAFALQAKSLAYGRRRFDRAMAWAFNKKCNGRATRSKPCCSWDGRTAGDARRIMMLPGAAARAPIKKDSDIRPRGMATKVRTPFRQTSNATLEAAFAFRRQPVTVARGNELTNDRHTTGAISFFCPVGDAERHDVRSGHPINSFAFAPVGGTVGVTNRLTFDAATQAGCWQCACRFRMHHDGNRPASVQQRMLPLPFIRNCTWSVVTIATIQVSAGRHRLHSCPVHFDLLPLAVGWVQRHVCIGWLRAAWWLPCRPSSSGSNIRARAPD